MVTQFGKKLRILRMDNGELLKDMADKLGVASSFLSAIEFGDKNVPKDFLSKLMITYQIPDEEVDEWRKAIEDSVKQTKINLQKASLAKRKAALVFSRNFDDMPEDTAKRILEIFSEEDDV